MAGSRASRQGCCPPAATPAWEALRLLTVGHGTASREEFTQLVRGAGVELVVDVRTAPGSRRSPQFGRAELQALLPAAAVGYRWEPRLGGFRRPAPDSPNVALRHASFRGYADYMASDTFGEALAGLAAEAIRQVTAVMCAETLWWRCHRRLIADAAVLLCQASVWHLGHNGKLTRHELTDGVRRDATGCLIYDGG